MNEKLSYEKCLEEMYALGRFGIILGLSTIKNILNNLGNPQHAYKCIHIAGTNGKGSIAKSLSTILIESGYKIGLFTSPHLVHFNERICIDNTPVSNDEVIDLYREVSKADDGERQATFFELNTAMALHSFKNHQVDWAIIETGMGGRLDSTNVITPEISVITNISLEHKMYLGNTIAEIAGEKGGIIKEKVPVITCVQQKSAIEKIESIAKEKQAPLYRLKKDFKTRKNTRHSFSYFGIHHTFRNVDISLKGGHQTENAAAVLATCEILEDLGVRVTEKSIRTGLINTKWPGRLETVSTEPLVIIDGAHNPAAIRSLSEYLKEQVKNDNLTLVTGILDDKPFENMLKLLLPICSRVILTRPDNERSTDPELLLNAAKKIMDNVTVIPNVAEAVKTAIETASPEDTICISGSLYLVGEAKKAFWN